MLNGGGPSPAILMEENAVERGASSGDFAVQELYICDAWSVYLSSHKYFSSTCLALVLYSDPKTFLIIIDPVTWSHGQYLEWTFIKVKALKSV
jgi:hypothetical protein